MLSVVKWILFVWLSFLVSFILNHLLGIHISYEFYSVPVSTGMTERQVLVFLL